MNFRHWQLFNKKLKDLGEGRLNKLVWPGISDKRNGGERTISVAEPIHFKKVRYRATNAKHRFLDIRVSGEIHLTKTNGQQEVLDRYITLIAYYDRTAGLERSQLTQIDGFHFDFESPPQTAHPVFHAQHKPTVLEDVPIHGGEEIVPNGVSALRSARIPSAQLDFVSSLIMVAADYLVSDDNLDAFRELLNWADHSLTPLSPPNQAARWPKVLQWYL